MKKSEKGTKKFTEAEKLAILEETKAKGVKVTLDKYGLYPATYYYWKRNYAAYGSKGLQHKKKEENAEIKFLLEENAHLKMLLAEKELEIKYPGISFKKARQGWKKLKLSER